MQIGLTVLLNHGCSSVKVAFGLTFEILIPSDYPLLPRNSVSDSLGINQMYAGSRWSDGVKRWSQSHIGRFLLMAHMGTFVRVYNAHAHFSHLASAENGYGKRYKLHFSSFFMDTCVRRSAVRTCNTKGVYWNYLLKMHPLIHVSRTFLSGLLRMTIA